jgi:peptide/nickel transport system permease protein
VRLFRYIYDVFFRLDFGESYITGIPIIRELIERFPRTLFLDIVSILCSVGIGIPLGVNAAINQNKPADYTSMILALVGVSIPGFWLALMMVLLFSVEMGILPAYGMGGPQYWILPILSGSFMGVAMQARQTRSSMLDVLNSDYIIMAKSKGLSKKTIIYKHALPNSLIPVITIAGGTFAYLLGGNVLVETIFSIPGIGNYMVRGINNRDFPIVQGSVLFLTIAFSVIMLLTDLVMAAIDPRIKDQFASGKRRHIRG